MSRFSLGYVAGNVLLLAAGVQAGEFANSVLDYTQGTVDSAGWASAAAALGKPATADAYGYVVTPFNANWEPSEIVKLGLGGSLTVKLPTPVQVTGEPIIGIFSDAMLYDPTYSGHATNPAMTTARGYSGVPGERTGLVSVADQNQQFVSIGRIVFAQPSNAWASNTDPYLGANSGTPADYFKPFAGTLNGFNNLDYTQILATLDGSAGGTWIAVPTSSGLSQVSYVRISDPLWIFDDATLHDQYTTGSGDTAVTRHASLNIDAVSAVPEPGSAVLAVAGIAIVSLRRRSRK